MTRIAFVELSKLVTVPDGRGGIGAVSVANIVVAAETCSRLWTALWSFEMPTRHSVMLYRTTLNFISLLRELLEGGGIKSVESLQGDTAQTLVLEERQHCSSEDLNVGYWISFLLVFAEQTESWWGYRLEWILGQGTLDWALDAL